VEFNIKELGAIEQVTGDGQQEEVQELSALQLAIVGGGVGEVIFG
jgi:hypothetical protein